jgi:hypothetical protein
VETRPPTTSMRSSTCSLTAPSILSLETVYAIWLKLHGVACLGNASDSLPIPPDSHSHRSRSSEVRELIAIALHA